MQITLCHDVVAFVEGTMERIFLNNNFPKIDVIPISNGKTWTTETLCQQIITKYKAKKIFPGRVVVWFDREKNADDLSVIAEKVRTSFVEAGYPADRVHCLIPDRMSENIILADEELIREETGIESYCYEFEGSNGKHHISEIWRSIKRTYKETTEGAALLKRVRLPKAAKKCVGAANFLATFHSDCWWITDVGD